nr:hypothetical protein [Tanacetum cinerariifolium]
MKTLNVTNVATKALSNSSSHTDSKLQKDYKTEYKKMKAKLALLEEEVSEDEEVTQVKVLMDLADDELNVGKSHARNGSCFKLRDNAIDLSIPLSKRETRLRLIPKQMTQESSKIQKTDSSKSADSSRMSQDSKPKVQNTRSSKSLRPKPIQKPQLKCELYHYTNHSTDDCYRILYCMICKRDDHRSSDHEMYIASLRRSENYKAQPYQYASSSKQILKAKAKSFPPCTHYGFNDHKPDDCKNYPECEICGSYDHSTSGQNRVIHIRGGVLAESS